MGSRSFAVFDIDGTLIRWQLYHAVVDELARNGHIDSSDYELVKSARMDWKNRKQTDSFSKYELTLIEVFERATKKLSVSDFDTAVHTVIDRYKDQVYVFTRDLIKDLKAKNYFLIAISGSHNELINLLSNHYGFDDFIGSKYQRKDGNFSGDKFIASFDKGTHLKNLITKHNLTTANSYGVGDTSSDIAVFEIVDNPIAFNPDQKLMNRAKASNWQIVIERKNVIYKLQPDSNGYRLVN